ncbi:GTP pyrophosphokinase [Fructilactobacillus lindneri]|nr:bifunctional (p)ppGpp synthetase/guanosine-3',5'-bis(diphosphate) 3'-pyrophosphohydrolase [Fructilactobacillus lindneri]ANZ58123.1 GTP pyrophosphokinase [Fructilactobacillus lindneri]ANZ59444.1 GTP pyrophosphokinase [Fructilactobacillus lindneri]POG98772.1 GTP pyrophosphokinase [Fructilactobacillus lindneri]POH03045.1 GTP pyrophosphokinase [Fructilactobacillus lindneri]POH04160.1 GTP pyrophosphokinase [Fructilactobacillus lindneri]
MASLKSWQPEEIFNKVAENMTPEQVDIIQKAYEFAATAHGDNLRASGEKYITHATQVAGILADLNMDPVTVTAGFLHDIVEDSNVELSDVRELFGDDVALIVDGVTKISKIKYKSTKEQLAENYRKLLLVMCQDIRVMIVKLADRMDNMDTLNEKDSKSQKRFARETIDVYAPIADRLGMGSVKWELQDMSLRYLNPDAYYEIAHSMKSKRDQREAYIANAIKEVQNAITDFDINADIYGRPKHIYSIYKKMVDKHKKFAEIYDLSAIRIIVDTVKDCYAVLGAIHAEWKPMPGRFKDYIAMPKSNMYQSLHTTVVGPEGKPLEIQIRTKEMHQIAEYGVAAHWAYKKGETAEVKSDQNNVQLNWFKRIIEIQEETDNASEFMDSVQGDLFSDHVYAFTPSGDVMELPKGAGPLDMAYAIHTQVGDKTTGARVNGKMVSLDDQIKNGDIVEIITSSNSTGPGKDWLDLVHTNSAKHKIKLFFKKENRAENIKAGSEILNDNLEETGFEINEILSNDNWNRVLEEMHYRSRDDLLAALGFGDIHVNGVINRFTSNLRSEQQKDEEKQAEKELLEQHQSFSTKNEELKNHGNHPANNVVIEGIDNVLVRMGHCCLPVPGDNIVGYITKGRGITIHRVNCNNIANDDGNRTITSHWRNIQNNQIDYPTKLKIETDDRNGILNDIIKKINNSPAKLTSIDGKVHDGIALTVSLVVNVKNISQLEQVVDTIKMVPGVDTVERTLN